MKDNIEPKYNRVVAYIRKSSEDNKEGRAHKQLNSLKYQKTFVDKAIKDYNLKLVHPPFIDDKTGYEAYVRDGFEEMLTYLQDNKNKVDGIVCTEINRLARNFGDGGRVLWYMQDGIIKRIYTHSKMFEDSSSDQLMVAIEFAMSKKSSDETGMRTKLAMRSKVKTMRHPSRPAILGYRTVGKPGVKKWIIDKKTGPLVRRVFERFSTGEYTLKEIADYAYSIGLRSTSSNSKTNKISVNTWRNRLKDIKYTGIFYHEGEKVDGKYEPIVDSALFYKVQAIFEKKKHPKSTHMYYAYTGMVTCPDCREKLSGTHKKGITYYRCGKRKLPCKNRKRIPYIPETELEEELVRSFRTIEIDQKTWSELRKYVNEYNQPEMKEVKRQMVTLNGKIVAERKMQTQLGRKFAKDLIQPSEYNKLVEDSRVKEESLRESYVKCENYVHELNELMYKFLDDIKHITKRFESSSASNRRELVDIFCENLRWDGKKAQWDWKKPYFILANQPQNSTMLPG